MSNLFVKSKKIIPYNLYEATFDHTLVLGIALDQQAYFPDSLGEIDLEAAFKIVEGYCDHMLKMSDESKQGFMEQVHKRMKALSVLNTEKKAEVAKKKTGKDTTESYVSATSRASNTRSSFMRASAILDSGGNVAEKMDNMSEFSEATLATIDLLSQHVKEFSMVILSVLEAIVKNGGKCHGESVGNEGSGPFRARKCGHGSEDECRLHREAVLDDGDSPSSSARGVRHASICGG